MVNGLNESGDRDVSNACQKLFCSDRRRDVWSIKVCLGKYVGRRGRDENERRMEDGG